MSLQYKTGVEDVGIATLTLGSGSVAKTSELRSHCVTEVFSISVDNGGFSTAWPSGIAITASMDDGPRLSVIKVNLKES